MKLEEPEAATGISSSAPGSYENENNSSKEINYGSLLNLAKFYGVSVDYILCLTENREQANTPLTELHLSDKMAALLKSGRVSIITSCLMQSSGNLYISLKNRNSSKAMSAREKSVNENCHCGNGRSYNGSFG